MYIKNNHDHKEWQGAYGYDTIEHLRINVHGFVFLKCDCDASWSHSKMMIDASMENITFLVKRQCDVPTI